jgi:hypothetical protein
MGGSRGSVGKFTEGTRCFGSSIDRCVGDGRDKGTNIFLTRDASRATEFLGGRSRKNL